MNFPAEQNPEGNLFIECANGNKDAETCVVTIYQYIDWLDNIIDEDVAQSIELSAKTSLNLFLMLSFNSFWNQHKQSLAGVLISGFNAWLDSETLRHHKDYRFRLTADVLKGYFMEFFYQVAYITGGYDLMRRLSQKWRGVDFDSKEESNKEDPKSQWKLATVPHSWSFPQDHFDHPEYAVEWWYFSGNLKAKGKDIGYHYCQFRLGQNDYRTHVSLFKDGQLFQSETKHDMGWIDFSFGGRMVLEFIVGDMNVYLELKHAKEVILQGKNKDGLSQKSAHHGHATHYYSIADIRTKGTIDGVEVEGRSWFEHEFGSFPKPKEFRWIFFYAHMESGCAYHAYILFNNEIIDQEHSRMIKYQNGQVNEIKGPFHKQPLSDANGFMLITQQGAYRVVLDTKESPKINSSLGEYLELPCTLSHWGDAGRGYLEITK